MKKRERKNGWYLEVTGDCNDDDLLKKNSFFNEEEKELAFWLFKKIGDLEGIHHWAEKEEDEQEMFEEDLYDDLFSELLERIPCDEMGPVHTITDVLLLHVENGRIEEIVELEDDEIPSDEEIYEKFI